MLIAATAGPSRPIRRHGLGIRKATSGAVCKSRQQMTTAGTQATFPTCSDSVDSVSHCTTSQSTPDVMVHAKRAAHVHHVEMLHSRFDQAITNTEQHLHWPREALSHDLGPARYLARDIRLNISRAIAGGYALPSEMAIADVGDARISALVNACAEANARADVILQSQRARLDACADAPYYYINWPGSGQSKDSGECRMPLVHAEMLLGDLLAQPALVESVRLWMVHQTVSHDLWSAASLMAFSDYCTRGYRKVWDAFTRGDLKTCPAAEQLSQAFCEPWVAERPLPEGMLLFEGQGVHEDDVSGFSSDHYAGSQAARAAVIPPSQHQSLGTIIERRRPTSAAWVPAAAIAFVDTSRPLDDLQPPARLLESVGIDVEQYARSRQQYGSSGCLLVYRIASPGVKGVLRQTMYGAIHHEAEVILQPGLRISITRIERNVELSARQMYRLGMPAPAVLCTVIYADVTPLDTTIKL